MKRWIQDSVSSMFIRSYFSFYSRHGLFMILARLRVLRVTMSSYLSSTCLFFSAASFRGHLPVLHELTRVVSSKPYCHSTTTPDTRPPHALAPTQPLLLSPSQLLCAQSSIRSLPGTKAMEKPKSVVVASCPLSTAAIPISIPILAEIEGV